MPHTLTGRGLVRRIMVIWLAMVMVFSSIVILIEPDDAIVDGKIVIKDGVTPKSVKPRFTQLYREKIKFPLAVCPPAREKGEYYPDLLSTEPRLCTCH